MKVELTKTLREQLLMSGHRAGSGSTGRDTLDTVWWDKVHATPHGHQPPPRDPSKVNPVGRSRVVMDHFRYPRGSEGEAVVADEYKSNAKRKEVNVDRVNKARDNMFEVRLPPASRLDHTWVGRGAACHPSGRCSCRLELRL